MHEISSSLHLAERVAHLTLIVMAFVYTLRVIWLIRFKAGRDRQARTGMPGRTTPGKGILYSWANIGMPWAMESTRRGWFMYSQFVLFHLGVVFAISLTFVIPFAPGWLENPIIQALFRLVIGLAFLVGLMRIVRRIVSKYMRAISTPDDHFSLWLLTIWFLFGFLSAPNTPQRGEFAYLVFFWMTTFFLLYVPFSKISHYLYYPFTRYYFGKTMGHRGVYPLVNKRVVAVKTVLPEQTPQSTSN